VNPQKIFVQVGFMGTQYKTNAPLVHDAEFGFGRIQDNVKNHCLKAAAQEERSSSVQKDFVLLAS